MTLKSNQKKIHQQEGDFAEVTHLKLSGSLEEIGFKLGNIAREQHAISRSRNPDTLKNTCQKQYIKEHYPVHYQRMKGLAHAYSENLENTAYDFTCFGNPLGEGLCSAVFYPPEYTDSKNGILSRNADLPALSLTDMVNGSNSNAAPAASSLYVVEMYPDRGYASLINLSFELFGLGLDGMNSEGLVVTHLFADTINTNLYKPSREYGVGINEMLVVQFLLDNCKTVDEAKELLLVNKHFYMLLPTHLLIADRQGKSFVWEYSPQHNQEFLINRNSGIQIITNHPLHEFPNPDAYPASADKSSSFERFRTLKHAIDEEKELLTDETIKKINSQVFVRDEMYEKPPGTRVRTIYHNVYNTHKKSMEISFFRKDEGNLQLRTEYFRFQLDDII